MATYDVHLANTDGQVTLLTVEADSVHPLVMTRQGMAVDCQSMQLSDSEGDAVLVVPLHSLVAIERKDGS